MIVASCMPFSYMYMYMGCLPSVVLNEYSNTFQTDFQILVYFIMHCLKPYPNKVLPFLCAVKQPDRLLKHLEDFEKLLNHSEDHIVTSIATKSLFVAKPLMICLEKDWELCDPQDDNYKLTSLIPKTIMIHHYVHFRMALRRSVSCVCLSVCLSVCLCLCIINHDNGS